MCLFDSIWTHILYETCYDKKQPTFVNYGPNSYSCYGAQVEFHQRNH